jgi:dTDP-4-dehydrorhamnose 3,5-epimerase
MKFVQTALQEVIEVTPEPHPDSRGWFARVWCHDEFRDAGLELRWVQANEAFSERKGTLRGVHLQHVPDE